MFDVVIGVTFAAGQTVGTIDTRPTGGDTRGRDAVSTEFTTDFAGGGAPFAGARTRHVRFRSGLFVCKSFVIDLRFRRNDHIRFDTSRVSAIPCERIGPSEACNRRTGSKRYRRKTPKVVPFVCGGRRDDKKKPRGSSRTGFRTINRHAAPAGQ